MDIPDKMVPIGIHCRLKWKHKARQCLKGGMLWLFPFYLFFYQTRVRSFAMLVSILTDSLLFSEFDWCDPGVWRCQFKTRWRCFVADVADEDRVGNSFFCRFGSWSLVIKLNFCLDFNHKVWSIFWSWCSGKIFKLEFGQYFAAEVL